MDKAINPNDGQVYDINTWLKEFSSDKKGICMVCGTDMKVRAENTPARTTHFWHVEENCNCPTILKNKVPYSDLEPTELDEENAQLVKKQFSEQFYQIYMKCDYLCDGITFPEFKELIAKATDKRVWYYKDLSIGYMPYILLTIGGKFSSKTNSYRKRNFYFCFEANLRNFDDLWITTKLKKKIWKVYPDAPKEIEEFDINFDYPTEPNWIKRSRSSIEKLLKLQ